MVSHFRLVSERFQERLQEIQVLLLVLDDEDPLACGHDDPPMEKARTKDRLRSPSDSADTPQWLWETLSCR